jgi:GMP synthase (glutamine-hydrolysing)
MEKVHDQEHDKANCVYQHHFFNNIISSNINNSQISVFNSYEEDINSFEFSSYDAFLWTGGLGNIYTSNQHNRDQLIICEKILKLEKPLWGSCWGLQVVATCFGDTIKKSTKPEFGYSDNIKIIKNHNVYENKQDTFSAPGHHYDCLESLCSEFEVISQNNLSIQSIAHKDKNIFCTQYHPELPYNFIGNLMKYWKKNYLQLMTEEEFSLLLSKLESLETEDKYNRKLEIENWLKFLSNYSL